MSNIYVLVNQDNADRNSLIDLQAAVSETGATVVAVNEESHLLEVTAPAHVVSTIAAMEGVCYVRCLFNYIAASSSRAA